MKRRIQRLGGGLIALVGAGGVGWSWFTALDRGYFMREASVLFPAFLVIGVALVAFPGYREERIARGEDISQLHGRDLITLRWWIVIGLALVAGAAHYVVLRLP